MTPFNQTVLVVCLYNLALLATMVVGMFLLFPYIGYHVLWFLIILLSLSSVKTKQ